MGVSERNKFTSSRIEGLVNKKKVERGRKKCQITDGIYTETKRLPQDRIIWRAFVICQYQLTQPLPHICKRYINMHTILLIININILTGCHFLH